jgi:putative ABC transport system permease protein
MSRLFLIAFRNILEHRRRSLTLGAAIALVTVLLVLLMGISNGIQSTLFRSATTLIAGHVTVGGVYKFTPSSAAPIVTDYREIRTLVEENVEGIDYVIDRMRGFGKIISFKSSQFTLIAGIDIEEESGFREVLSITKGSIDDLSGPDTILIFEKHAERLGVRVGDELIIKTPTFRGVQNTVNVRIVAIAKDIGLLSSFMTYVRKDTVRKLYDLTDKATGAIFVYLEDIKDVPKTMEKIREVLNANGYDLMEHEKKSLWEKLDTIRREGWTGQKIDVTAWDDEIVNLAALVKAFDAVSMAVVLVLLIIIVIGLMNALWMAIRERTSEIGTLRAIGMQRSSVLMMIMMEAVTLTLMASLIGIGLGYGIAAGVSSAGIEITSEGVRAFLMSDVLYLEVNAEHLIQAVLTITGFNALGSLYPAWRAARIPPVVAMQKG